MRIFKMTFDEKEEFLEDMVEQEKIDEKVWQFATRTYGFNNKTFDDISVWYFGMDVENAFEDYNNGYL